jgi:hypothetical protein
VARGPGGLPGPPGRFRFEPFGVPIGEHMERQHLTGTRDIEDRAGTLVDACGQGKPVRAGNSLLAEGVWLVPTTHEDEEHDEPGER